MIKQFVVSMIVILFTHIACYSQNSNSSISQINDFIEKSYPELEAHVGIDISNNFYYAFYEDGIEFTYTIPFQNIKRGEIVSSYRENFVSLWCSDTEFYCVESNIKEFGVTKKGNERLMNIYIGSKSDAETLLGLISSLSYDYSGNDFHSVNTQKLVNRNVFICDSNGAYAYHSKTSCSGLNNCEYTIYKISEKGAINEGYRYCELCWE